MPHLPFITGSHAYGTPHKDSDVDVVVYTPERIMLTNLEDIFGPLTQYGENRFACRCGCLNLIVCCDADTYDKWLSCTNELIARKPVTREESCLVFNAAGITGGSSGTV